MGGVVWLASYPRSGNTWMRVFLHNLFNVIEGKPSQDINALVERSVWDIGEAWYRPLLNKAPNQASEAEVAAVRPKAQERIAASADGLIFVKTHAAMARHLGTPTINFAVTAGAVYIVRDPRGTAVSFAAHMGRSIDQAIEAMGMEGYKAPNGPTAVYELYGSWSQNVRSWTASGHKAIHVVRYEDLLADPQTSFAKIVSHLAISATEGQISEAIELSSFKRLQQAEKATSFREKPKESSQFFRSGQAGRGCDELSRAQNARLLRDHGTVMKQFGYLD